MSGTITIDGKTYPITNLVVKLPRLQRYQQHFIENMTWRRVRASKGWRRHVRRMKARGMMR